MAGLGVVATTGLIGTLPGWLTFVGVLAAAWIFYRGGAGTAVKGLQDTNRELERQLKQKEGQISALERINAELRAQKDVTFAIEPVIEAMQAHEHRAQERHEKTLIVMDLIAERLGPEHPNGHPT
jgi:hypothetical protein